MFLASKKKMTLATKNRILEIAKKKAINYCIENGLSLNKFSMQSFYVFGDIAAFMQEMDYHGTGLLEDLSSQPKPTLEYDILTETIRPSKYVDYLRD